MTVHQHLPAGTILLADSQALGCAGMVFRVDPVTGEVGQFALGSVFKLILPRAEVMRV
ncbi:hypothetical protein ACFYN3_41530 [Streptomyces lavendulae]|uniref:hypothetical protein n=1 Tax=Streptomyces lavendulae TaxID=1914 RepID=UPI00340F8C8D